MWKMIFHFFLLLFVLICVLLKTICSILIEHAMKNKYYGKRGRKPHSHKWCYRRRRHSRHAVLVWCKNTAKDSHFCIKPYAKGEETARADDKADIHKMIFWRARERKKKKYELEHDGDGVIHQSNTLHTNSLFRQSSFIQMEIFWYWKFPHAKHERRIPNSCL